MKDRSRQENPGAPLDRTFMEVLGKHGVPVMDYPHQDLQGDLGHA